MKIYAIDFVAKICYNDNTTLRDMMRNRKRCKTGKNNGQKAARA